MKTIRKLTHGAFFKLLYGCICCTEVIGEKLEEAAEGRPSVFTARDLMMAKRYLNRAIIHIRRAIEHDEKTVNA